MPLNIVTDDQQEPAPSAQPVTDAPAGSVLNRLRQRAAQQRRDQTLDADIWDGVLVARYRMPPMEEADRLMAAGARLVGEGPGPSMSHTAVDLMATCCLTLLGVDEDGRTEDLHVRFTGRLLELVGIPLPAGVDNPNDVTATEVIGALFADNWLAVNVHAAKVMDWLQRGGDALGEASAAP
jgi:hypothetical protein